MLHVQLATCDKNSTQNSKNFDGQAILKNSVMKKLDLCHQLNLHILKIVDIQ